MFTTIITDCSDANAQGRQETRARILLGHTPTFVPLPGSLDEAAMLEASGNIVDTLDAVGEVEGIVIANVAPRNGDEKRWGNGTPFGYFRYMNTFVVTTVTGPMLSLPHKLGLIQRYQVIDMEATLHKMVSAGILTKDDARHINTSQFRSYDFLPRAAAWLTEGHEMVTEDLALDTIAPPGARVWAVDNFGNAKTTLLGTELPTSGTFETRWGVLPVVRSLKDVPDGTVALTVGSSGLRSHRFVEVVIQGKSAAHELGITPGTSLTV